MLRNWERGELYVYPVFAFTSHRVPFYASPSPFLRSHRRFTFGSLHRQSRTYGRAQDPIGYETRRGGFKRHHHQYRSERHSRHHVAKRDAARGESEKFAEPHHRQQRLEL